MTDDEIENLFNQIKDENAERVIKIYLNYMDKEFIDESKKGAFRTLAYMKKQYAELIQIHRGLLQCLELSQKHIEKLNNLFKTLQ